MPVILGNGKDGIVYTLLYRGREYAIKQFKPQKSLNKIQLEADLQRKAAKIGISPKVKECNLDKRYIRMDKLDKSLYKLMQNKGGKLSIKYQKAIVEIRVNKVFATYSFGSIAGQSIVYIPWGSKTNRYGPESVPQTPPAQKPLRSYEMIFAEIEWKPEGQNFWKVTKI